MPWLSRLAAIVALPAALVLTPLYGAAPARAQGGPPGPPAVGVVKVAKTEVTETQQFVGRIQATDRVDLNARVTAFVEKRLFREGTEVKQGDTLYELERGPFEAAVAQATAMIAQYQATLANATTTLNRATSLLRTPAGQQSTVDDARAAQLTAAAQVAQAQAQLRTAQINLAYTTITAPVSGKIGQTRFSVGNVVGPTSGPLNTIVSQNPMYVAFPIASRALLDLEHKYAGRGGLDAVVLRLLLPDGRPYDEVGKLDFVDPSVAADTDTITLRGTIPNPPRREPEAGQPVDRLLIDGEFVTVLVEGIEPVQVLAIPRTAVLTDQQGSYVYVVGPGNKAEVRRIQLGQSTPTVAAVTNGLTEGETVIADGLQRVRPGQPVSPGPATPMPTAPSPAGGGGSAKG